MENWVINNDEDAKRIIDKIVGIKELEFDVEDSGFGDGSKNIQISNVFDDEEEAQLFIDAIRLLLLA